MTNEQPTDLPKPLPNAPIRVCDFAERLTRLNVFHEQKEIDQTQLVEELDRVCIEVWGFRPDEVDETLLSAEDRRWLDEVDSFEASDFAEKQGYDLGIDNLNVLHDWDTFLFMILARARGILTKENWTALRLRREAEGFVVSKARGTISGR